MQSQSLNAAKRQRFTYADDVVVADRHTRHKHINDEQLTVDILCEITSLLVLMIFL